jgi:hypothetical protein
MDDALSKVLAREPGSSYDVSSTLHVDNRVNPIAGPFNGI